MSYSSTSSAPGQQPIRILVADRDRMGSQLLAESLARDSAFEITAVASALDVLRTAITSKSDVALIGSDCDNVPRKGLQVARTLSAHRPDIRIVILLEANTRETVLASFRSGATGVFCRSEPLSELHSCIRRVSRGEIWASSSQSQCLLETLRSTPSCEGIRDGRIGMLSKRELEVAECAVQGQTNRQIADNLHLSEHTVKNYLFRVFDKLGVSSRFELLFLLFNENHASVNSAGPTEDALNGNPMDPYFKAADDGFIAAQFIVGLAHLEGYCVEKNNRSAYYWLRIAQENSSGLHKRTRSLVAELRTTMKFDEVEALERNVASAVRRQKVLAGKSPAELIKQNPGSRSGTTAV
jgi:two-component system, NarL family, nitrate/nitrite response regulator NarL